MSIPADTLRWTVTLLGAWLIVAVAGEAAQAQLVKTSLVNDTDVPVKMTILHPPFPPVNLPGTLRPGGESTVGASAGSTIRLTNANTGELVQEVKVTQDRRVTIRLDMDLPPAPKPPDIGPGPIPNPPPDNDGDAVTSLVNQNPFTVRVVVLDPEGESLDFGLLRAGQTMRVESPNGAKVRIISSQSGRVIQEIVANGTRTVRLSVNPNPMPNPNPIPEPEPIPDPDPTPTPKPGPAGESTMYLVMACDADDPLLGEGFEINHGQLVGNFMRRIASRNFKVIAPWVAKENPQKLTIQSLLQTIDRLPVRPQDTLVVYVACHGAYDRDQRQAFFRFENSSDSVLLRKTLVDRIKGKGTRLGMLITDACTNYDKLPAQKRSISPVYPPVEVTEPLYQSLFFDHQGFLDLSSSSPGEYTLYYNNYKNLENAENLQIMKYEYSVNQPGHGLDAYDLKLRGEVMKGGLFTESMLKLLTDNQTRKHTWTEFVRLLQQDVARRFQQENPDGQLQTADGNVFQDSQTVFAAVVPQPAGSGTTPVPRPNPNPTPNPTPSRNPASELFGLTVQANPGGGVKITAVKTGTTAANYRLRIGEVIQRINNQAVNSPAELETVLNNAGESLRMTIDGESFLIRR